MNRRPSRTVLVLFCKQPRLGYGKQRLAVSIGKARALGVAEALVECALEDALAWNGPFVIAAAAPTEADWARSVALRSEFRDKEVAVRIQCAGNLGERIADMDARLRSEGANRIVIMGSDAPALEPSHYERVVTGLTSCDVVLADGTDGGVTLMASRSGWPQLNELPWSTGGLADALSAACTSSGRRVDRFDGGRDLDGQSDIEPLLGRLADDPRPARQALVSLLRDVTA